MKVITCEFCCYIVCFYDEMGNTVSKEFDKYEDAEEYANIYSYMTEVNIFQLGKVIR